MILAPLSTSSHYSLNERFTRGFEFLRTADLEGMDEGKHAIEGDDLFVIIMEYTTKPSEECPVEAHRRYADIQYMIRGQEIMKVAPLAANPETQAYDEEKDFALFQPETQDILVKEGMFAVFFPHDLHGPCVMSGSPAPIRKAVVKVRL